MWRRLAAWVVIVGGCGPAGVSSESPQVEDAPASVVETAAEPDDTAEATQPDPRPPIDDDGHGHGVLHDDLNARYVEQTDVRKWRSQFERPSREVRRRRDEIVAAVGLTPGDRVADLGAGTGLYTFAFADAVGPKGHVFAVDVQDYFLHYLSEQATARGLAQVSTVAASQRDVNLEPASIDVAFMCDAYHHVEHPAPYLATLHAALRPGGRFVVVDYANVDGAASFVREHVRDAPEVFRAEIEAAGFRFLRADDDFLKENFLFVFERA